MKNSDIHWQPTLIGKSFRLRPLAEEDFDTLFSAASDPLIWELHPDRLRYTRERFEAYFRSGIESQGALAVMDLKFGRLIGSSRYTDYNSQTSSVEIGFTFLTRDHWGGMYNRELKTLMMSYAFQYVNTIYFVVGKNNHRSRKAMLKIGGVEVIDRSSTPVTGDINTSAVYQIRRSDWLNQNSSGDLMLPFDQPVLDTARLILEPILEGHAQELRELFQNPDLHQFIPSTPPTLEQQTERCVRWVTRRSPDGKELWLNWAARDKETGKVIAHFQAGINRDAIATISYLVAREFQNKGFATEGLEAVFNYLNRSLSVKEVKAWTDTRNEASHRLAKKLGMVQVEFIKDADFFKGTKSDEFVFSKSLK